MKKLRIIPGFLFLLAVATGCSVEDGIDQDTSFLDTANTENLTALFDITNDNSGDVTVTPTAKGATAYTIDFGHGDPATVTPGMNATHSYPEGEYTVKITAQNVGGGETTEEFPLSMVYRAPENVTLNLSGNMKVSAEADYANGFIVYYGDGTREGGVPLAVGEELPPHTYDANGGPYTLKVVALSGGEAKTEVTKNLFGLPIGFEIPDVAFFGTFDDWGQQQFATVDNPDASGINTSDKVGMFTNGHAPWSGTYSPLNIPIYFNQGQKVSMMVYNPDAANIGKKINMELEWAVGTSEANPYGAVAKMPITTSGEWEEITFDFSGIDAIPDDAQFTQLVFRFNDAAEGAGEVIYFDNITLITD